MTDGTNQPDAGPPARRGEAAWKAARDEIAERNAKVSKRAVEERAARERSAHERRLASERVEDEKLAARKLDFR